MSHKSQLHPLFSHLLSLSFFMDWVIRLNIERSPLLIIDTQICNGHMNYHCKRKRAKVGEKRESGRKDGMMKEYGRKRENRNYSGASALVAR